jgi:hypothetical protein
MSADSYPSPIFRIPIPLSPPTRYVSGLNSGAGFIFDIGLINLKFSSPTYSVLENAGVATLSVKRCDPACTFGSISTIEWMEFMTGDGNGTGLQPIVDPAAWNPYGGTCTLRTGCISSATGQETCKLRSRAQKECRWLPSDGDPRQQYVERRGMNGCWLWIRTLLRSQVITWCLIQMNLPHSTPIYFSPISLFLSLSSPYFRSQFDFGAFSDYAPEHTVVGFTANQASYNLEVGRREISAPCSTVKLYSSA